MKIRSKLFIQFCLISLLLVALVCASYMAAYQNNVERLARSYARASRKSLQNNGLRDAIGSLAPALTDGFVAITALNNDNRVLLELPNTSAVADLSSFTQYVDIVIASDESEDLAHRQLTLRFYYSDLAALSEALFAALLTMLISFFFYRRSINQLENDLIRETTERRAQEKHALALQIAHDIRSPLSAINMVVKTLDSVSADKAELLTRAAKRINEIANDLLDDQKAGFVRASEGQMDTHSQLASKKPPTELRDLLEEIFEEKLIQICDRPLLILKIDISQGSSGKVVVDRKELARAVSNLVDNSIDALGDMGEITLGLRQTKDATSIIISDNGPGIEEASLANLGKQKFSSMKSGPGKGSGLGVFHAKSAVESMGGTLSLQSRIAVGTVVTITFRKSKPTS